MLCLVLFLERMDQGWNECLWMDGSSFGMDGIRMTFWMETLRMDGNGWNYWKYKSL